MKEKVELCSLIAQTTLLEKVKEAQVDDEEIRKTRERIVYGHNVQDLSVDLDRRLLLSKSFI